MKKFIIIILSVLAFSFNTSAQGETVSLDPETTTIKWTGRKLVGEHFGKIKIKSGQVKLDGNMIVGAKIIVDMSTITCDDIENPESNKGLVDHLKAKDFFSVEYFPIAELEIVDLNREDLFLLSANLTIKGQSYPVVFPYSIISNDGKTFYSATIRFDRTKYGIEYNSSLMDVAKDRMIEDIVELEVKFEL